MTHFQKLRKNWKGFGAGERDGRGHIKKPARYVLAQFNCLRPSLTFLNASRPRRSSHFIVSHIWKDGVVV